MDTMGSMRKLGMAIIKGLIMMILMGYMMTWTMMPTNTFWLHWLPNIHAKVDSTFFGPQGANILIYTFPIILIAVLACLYLHLENKDVHHYSQSPPKGSPWGILKRPAIVKGPLGIVSWTELWFLFMFFALLVWSLSSYLHSMFANITQQTASTMREKVWELKLDSAGLMLGLVGNISLAFIFFPVNRGSSLLRLVGLTSESSIKYHIWLGHTAMLFFTAHGLCYAVFWANTHQIANMWKWDKVGISNVAGEVALVAGLVMWATTFSRIRRNIFELFYYTHNYLYVIFVVFFVLHVGFSYAFITLPGFYLFLIDRYLRFLQSQQNVRLVSARVLPCQAVELNFSKSPGLSYNPTSTMFINLPVISKVQWHPFTVTSSSNLEPEKLSVVIKSENDKQGSWSQSLYQKLSSPNSPLLVVDHLQVSLEGPYGPTSSSQSFLRHNVLVMVTGGSGITPCISIIRQLLFLAVTTNSKIPRVHLVTVFKKSVDLALLDLIFPASTTNHDISTLNLQVEAYITREKKDNKHNNPNHTIWFKPRPSDAPVSNVLGSNNWLWLGAILISSSIVFLLLIGIVNQYYIYPIDRNTNMIYPQSSKSALNILVVCLSIAISASVAFVWNKKQNGREMRQVQNTDAPTPMTSPGPASWFYNADRELESLPHEPFVEATKVHYGERPDLKKILLDCEGSSIGVLVSGPKKMRQDVAAICSSGSASNLHFESISFSW